MLASSYEIENIGSIITKPPEVNILTAEESIQRIMSGEYNIYPHPNIDIFDYMLKLQTFMRSDTFKMAEQFGFIFLTDDSDDRRIIKRMHVLEQLFHDRRLTVENVPLVGLTRLQKIFSSLLLADWTSLKLAVAYGLDPEPVPMVEEFKKLII